MNREIIHNNVTIFSRWSRKSYSLFAAIGKVVHIGHLRSDMLAEISEIISELITFAEPQQVSEDDDCDNDVVLENELICSVIQDTACIGGSCSCYDSGNIFYNSFTGILKVKKIRFIQFLSQIYYDYFRT